jgi:RNA polymerase sigma-70 factor (ECF subfamily)
MTSEAAAYFPDALANTEEIHGPVSHAPESASTLVTGSQFQKVGIDHGIGANSQTSDDSDESLLEQVKQGAKEALSFLFRRHARSVRNVAHRILRDEAEADDLVQDVFIFVYRKASLFDASQGSARSWIIHVTYHRAFDRRRYLNSRHFYTSQELEGTVLRLIYSREEIPFYERSMEGIFGNKLTTKLNARLTSEQRETIQLYFFEGYALREIAQLTGRSLVTVRNHYYRGLERIREYVLPGKKRSK